MLVETKFAKVGAFFRHGVNVGLSKHQLPVLNENTYTHFYLIVSIHHVSCFLELTLILHLTCIIVLYQ